MLKRKLNTVVGNMLEKLNQLMPNKVKNKNNAF